MHFVYLTNNVVTDQSQVNPYNVFEASYASQFVQAGDEVTFGWRLIDGAWIPPEGPSEEQIKAQNKALASQLLADTDWTATVDIADQRYSNPYLVNQGDFISYRSQVRKIAVNPPSTLVTAWPVKPTEVWSS